MFGLDWSGHAAIFEAAFDGDEAKVRQILSEKVELVHFQANKQTLKKMPTLEEGMTPLHMAARGGHRGIVDLMLSMKADFKRRSLGGSTPLHMAAEGGHKEIAELFIDRGADAALADAHQRTPLHLAAAAGATSLVEYIASHGGKAAVKDDEGVTPLHHAARSGDRSSIMFLRAKGGQVNERDNRGRTTLHHALIPATHGVSGRYSPEQQAARENIKATVKLLLSLGADANAVDQSNETPLDMLVNLQGDALGIALTELIRANGGEWVRHNARFARAMAEPPAAAPPPAAAAAIPGMDRRGASAAGMTVVAAPAAASPLADASAPIVLGRGPLTLGRDYDCDVRLDSLTVSRKHARIERGRDGYVLQDLGSRNGTVVNGAKLREPTVLHAADLIGLGEYEYRFDGARLVPVGVASRSRSGTAS